MQVDMPKFLARKRLASASAPVSAGKTARVIAEAEAAADKITKGGKGKKQNILEQLVMILTRLSLAQSRELAEIVGILFCCVLLPLRHITAKTTIQHGDEYQDMVKELKTEKAEYYKNKEKKPSKKSEEAEEDDEELEMESDEDEDKDAPAELVAPHVRISLTSLGETISAGEPGESAEATAARQKLKQAWDSHIKGKEEHEIKQIVKVWRGRKPPRKGKGKKMMKMVLCLIPEVQIPLMEYLLLTGGVEKRGKAPRGWLEREASSLLSKLGKA